MCAKQQKSLLVRLGALIFALVAATSLLAVALGGPAAAQQIGSEALRVRAEQSKAAQTPQTFTAPMPDADVRAPYAPSPRLGVAPMLNRPADHYRGETFSAASTVEPGLHEQRFPISGIALKVPLK